MAHNANVNGTIYEISGGRTLVDGTGYAIYKGKTMVGGTVYEVGFGKTYTIKIYTSATSGFINDSSIAKVTINGQVYDGSTEVDLLLKEGTIIECYICSTAKSGTITLNNTTVKSEASDGSPIIYNYVVGNNAEISVYAMNPFGSTKIGRITITEQ